MYFMENGHIIIWSFDQQPKVNKKRHHNKGNVANIEIQSVYLKLAAKIYAAGLKIDCI